MLIHYQRLLTLILVLFFSGAIINGCSSAGSKTSPVLPDETQSPTVITGSTTSSGGNNRFCLLYNMIYLDVTDPDDLKYEVVPVRGGTTHLNILKLLETEPCDYCFTIKDISSPQPGVLDVRIKFRHPFHEPIFTVFDVRGILMFNGSHFFPESGLTISDAKMEDWALINADGYTTLYNGLTMGMAGPLFTYYPGKMSTLDIPSSDINGYLRLNTENSRNAYFAGDQYTRKYELKIGAAGTLALGYAVDASWEMPIHQPVNDPVNDFGPDANCPEPWKIEVQDIGHSLTVEGNPTKLQIDVYDWQGKDNAHPVLVECPDLFDGEVQANWVLDESGFTRYEAEIENVKLAGVGYYMCLIKKEAAENDPLSQPWLDLTAYTIFNVFVKEKIPTPVDITPPWLNFSPKDIFVDGNQLYIAGGVNGLHIFDISDPENPVWINRVDTPGDAYGVAVSGGYACVADYLSGLQIIDIDPPESAYIIKSFVTSGRAMAVAISGDYAYVGNNNSFQIIDIAVPESAYIMSTIDEVRDVIDIAVSDGYAYVTKSDHAFWVVDVEPPQSAFMAREIGVEELGGGLALSGGYAYVAGGDNGLLIYDIEPPESTYLFKTLSLVDTAHDVSISGDYAYVADNEAGIKVIDIQSPESAHTVQTISLPHADMISVAGGYAYAGSSESGFYVIDIDPLESACLVNSIVTPSRAINVVVTGGYAYIADYGSGLSIIDIDPVNQAFAVKAVRLPGKACGVAISGGIAYVTTHYNDFCIIDVDPPESAYILSTVDIPYNGYRVAVSGDYAYVANGHEGLMIIDIDPPESAYIIDTLDQVLLPKGVTVSGNYVYVPTSFYGYFYVINIEDPESAQIVKTIKTYKDPLTDVTISGGYAYVTGGDKVLQIIDIDPVDSAYVVSSYELGNGYGLVVSGGFAYIANDHQGLLVLGIEQPASPYFFTSLEMPDDARDIELSDGIAYVVASEGGLRIIQLY